jgi:transcriptional regulator with XRE-family HTH domain
LTQKLEGYGAQLAFARQIGISPGTINKWMTGQNTPNFESCLLIAEYFAISPAQIFRMAGKFNYHRLYFGHLDQSPRETKLHLQLQRLLDSGLEDCVEEILNKFEATHGSIQKRPNGGGISASEGSEGHAFQNLHNCRLPKPQKGVLDTC